MALTGLDIFKLLPKTNCKKCGMPTCLAFAMQLAQKRAKLEACPAVSEEAKQKLAAAAAPPIRKIVFGAGDAQVQVGQETVLFRHEEKFHNPTAVAATVSDKLAGPALQERLRAGKIYSSEKVPWALDHFFKDANLATLRELSLREVAESLDRSAAQAAHLGDAAAPARGRVMVALSSNPPRALALLRRGSRLAGRLNTDWFVAYVETPQEAPNRIDSEAQRHLLGNIDKARELGAEVVRLKSDRPAEALLDFARSHRVSDMIVGRTERPWWRRFLGRTVLQKLVDEATGLDLHIASFEDEQGGRP